jgi:RND family efflux transporter MFP subunit
VSLSTPRFRADLDSHRGELGGFTFYDVTDRATGKTFRMYEVEYLVARELDGRSLDLVAAEVTARLGVETNPQELAGYVGKLAELGFLEARELADDVDFAVTSVVQPAPPLAAQTPAPLPIAAAPRSPDGPARVPSLNEPPAPGPGDGARPLSAVFKAIANSPPVAAPAPPVVKPRSVPPPLTVTLKAPPRAVIPELPQEALAVEGQGKVTQGHDDGGDVVPADELISESTSLDEIDDLTNDALPIEPMAGRPLPLEPPPIEAPLLQPPLSESALAEFASDARTPVVDPREVETLVRQSVHTAPDREATLPQLPTADGRIETEHQTGETRAHAHGHTRSRRRGTSLFWLSLPLIIIAALVAIVYLPARHTSAALTVHVADVRVESVVRLYPGSAQLHAVEPLRFAFPEAGTIAELLPPGQHVKAGDTLAKLDGYVKLEKQLGELRAREAFYQAELAKAERAGSTSGAHRARAKVDEKRALIAALQARYGRLVLSSTTPGIVGENLVKVGDTTVAAQPVTSVLQLRLRADFTLPAREATSLKTGMIGRMARADGHLIDCRVERVTEEGEQTVVRVEVMDPAAGVQAGEQMQLVRLRLDGVVRLPAQAVTRPTGGQDSVFVVQDGRVRLRMVMVRDRSPREVLVSQGIAPGDRVVTSGTLSLHDGAVVSADK